MNNLIWSGVALLLLLSGCGWNGTPTRKNDFVPLTSIEIVADTKAIRDSRTIAAKTSTKLRVKGNFSGQFTDDITDRVVWSSDATDKADFVTAADPNRVTGKGPGTAVLTATVGNMSSTFTLTVSSATISTMTISPDNPTIAKGQNTQFAVSGTFSDGTTQDLTFDANWISKNTTVATIGDIVDFIVDEDRVVQRTVKAIADGTSEISATFEGVSDPTELTVTEPVLQSITVTTDNSSVLSLASATFKATGNFSDGSAPEITSQVTWSSSRPDIATIAAGGAVKTLAEGTTAITATLNNASGTPISGTANLKVTGGNLTKIVLSKDNTILADNGNITLVKDTSVRMTATGNFSNNTTRDISGVVEWSVANTSIANVSNTPGSNLALLNATAVTTPLIPTIVTAKSGTAPPVTFNLAVTAPTPQSLVINTPSGFTDLTANNSARFTATATFSDNSTQDVTLSLNTTWTSSNEAAATIGTSGLAKGQVTGKVTGNTTINATFVGAGGLTRSAPPVTIAVKTRTIQSLSISPNVSTVVSGNQVSFKALANYSDGTTNVDVTENTAWTINDLNVAKLADSTNQPGQVVGVDTGTAILTATFDGKSATANITVQ